MNLAVNARDAMPKGGTLTISTNPVEINDAYVQTHPEARLGAFVCLRVSDTGCGMDAATMARIFEPFFTTKEVGKGTGLGLATVYGIVKQHEGWIEVSSEVGKGSTFNVFLPASSEPVKAPPPESALAAAGARRPGNHPGGRRRAGVARHGAPDLAGLRLSRVGSGFRRGSLAKCGNAKPDAIDLVLTDMVMPGGMSGRELAVRLLANHPRLKVIFTSGYNVEEANTDFFRRSGGGFLAEALYPCRSGQSRARSPGQAGPERRPAGSIEVKNYSVAESRLGRC